MFNNSIEYRRNYFLQSNDFKKLIVLEMRQSIYIVRYKIQLVDGMRRRHRSTRDYRLAFLYAKLMALKSRMMDIYSTSKYHKEWEYYMHLVLYEKLVHINVDIGYYVDVMIKLHAEYLKKGRDRPSQRP